MELPLKPVKTLDDIEVLTCCSPCDFAEARICHVSMGGNSDSSEFLIKDVVLLGYIMIKKSPYPS